MLSLWSIRNPSSISRELLSSRQTSAIPYLDNLTVLDKVKFMLTFVKITCHFLLMS